MRRSRTILHTLLLTCSLPLTLACGGESSDDAVDGNAGSGGMGSGGEGSGGDGPGSAGSGGDGSGCDTPAVLIGGRCVVVEAHEPDERIDFDNVVDYSDGALTLDLPDPPKSGFRLVVPPRVIAGGATAESEVSGCVAWEYPEITHRNVYAARLYTTGMLHHSNMYGVPLGTDLAGNRVPSNYPECGESCDPATGQCESQDNIFGQVDNWMAGEITDVLFANSTQIEGGEAVVFPEGMAFRITTESREVVTTIHWLNTMLDDATSEIVYDFYTMPDELVEQTLVPFVFQNQDFTIPAQSISDITTTCDIAGAGQIVSFMPHTHSRTTRFTVEFLDANDDPTEVYRAEGFDLESDIRIYDTPLDLTGVTKIRHQCIVDNELDQELFYGIGVNEMCTLFGYLYPPEAQQLGIVLDRAQPCVSLNVGAFIRP